MVSPVPRRTKADGFVDRLEVRLRHGDRKKLTATKRETEKACGAPFSSLSAWVRFRLGLDLGERGT